MRSQFLGIESGSSDRRGGQVGSVYAIGAGSTAIGGRGGCTPEFIRLGGILPRIAEYLRRFSQDASFINAGLEQVSTDWLNQRP